MSRRTLLLAGGAVAAATAVAGVVLAQLHQRRRREQQNRRRKARAMRSLPLGMRLDEAFLPHLKHDGVMAFRHDYQRFREGAAFGAKGEVHEIAALPWSGDAHGEDHDNEHYTLPNGHAGPQGPALSSLPALFEVNRHLSSGSGAKLSSRPEIIEELQHRINEYRLKYRTYRKGSPWGVRFGDTHQLERLLHVAPVDLLPSKHLASMIKQQKALKMTRRTNSEKHLDKLGERKGLHVHFGAGRLGMGLVVPAISASGCPFAIVNPPFPEFDAFVAKHEKQRAHGGNIVLLELNGRVYGQLLMVTGEADLPALQQFLACVDSDEANGASAIGILAITSNDALLEPLIGKAKTFSASVGPGMNATASLLKKVLPDRSGAGKALIPSLAACENDHHAVEAMAETLTGRVAVAACLVDRICTRRDLITEAEIESAMKSQKRIRPSLVRSETEPWTGLIMVPPLAPGVFAYRVPFAGDHVMRPRLPAQASYITRRKIMCVNGMHTTLAFLALSRAHEDGGALVLDNDKLVAPDSGLPLITVAKADAATEKVIWAWCVARLMLLAFETGVEVMMLAHEIDTTLPPQEASRQLAETLWTYASQCVLRFDTTGDTCGRVLGGGVVNRMRGRLRPPGTFLEHNPNLGATLGGLAGALLTASGVDRAAMFSAVASLSAAAERLAGRAD